MRRNLFFYSLVELVQGGTGGLSVLRTFRLLRILKLVRFLPALKYQLIVMLRTMDNVAMFFALLLLFIFIFRLVQSGLLQRRIFSQQYVTLGLHY
jgi:voltage-dependent calcium channel T type alpha-1G